jgi:hypothetical protein
VCFSVDLWLDSISSVLRGESDYSLFVVGTHSEDKNVTKRFVEEVVARLSKKSTVVPALKVGQVFVLYLCVE